MKNSIGGFICVLIGFLFAVPPVVLLALPVNVRTDALSVISGFILSAAPIALPVIGAIIFVFFGFSIVSKLRTF